MFKKIFIILLFFISAVQAEIIDRIIVTGNNRISEETIKIYGEIETGKDYSAFDLNNVLKNLYSTEFFENVNLNLENNILTISLKEYPIINSIELIGEDSKKFKNAIMERLKLKEKQSFISSKLNSDLNLIKKFYSSIGFNFAEVEGKIENFSENRLNILFVVEKGNKSFIKKINFIGDKKIRDNKLANLIVSEEKKFWKFLSNNTYYNANNIELDKRLLLNYYKSQGYYDAQVLSSSSELKENEYTELTYTINAGPRYRITKITTNVSEVFNKKLFNPLNDIYLEFIGEYYSPFKIKKILDEIDLLISNNDLQFVEHSVSETLSNDTIEIKINVFEGQKEIVEKIIITGNTVTDETVVRSEFLFDEGDPFNALKFDQSIAKIKSRNIFGEIKTEVKEGTKKNLKILNIQVEEKPTGEISAGAGFGTNGGSFAFSISENNWLGKGINISTDLDVSSETFTGGIKVTDPNYNFSGNALTYFLSNTSNDKPKSGFRNNIFSLGTGISFEQFKDIYLSPSVIFSYDDLKVESTASSTLKKQKGTFTDLSLDYSITTDKRDRVYGPTDGYIVTFNQAIPLYADSPFIRNSVSFSKYNAFSEDIIGAFKLYGAAITGLNDKDVRLSKRLGLSSSRLRGFENGKIGPKDGNDYVGGNFAMATNFELNLPNLLPESTKVDVGLFLDVANIWHVDYDDTISDSNKIRSSAGINSSWLSPAGPMSFIFSKNISKAATDITESFNFRLGTTF